MHIFKLCVCALECDMHKFRSNICLCAEVISLSVYILSNLVCVYAFLQLAIPDEILESSIIIPSKANNYGKSLLSKMIFAAYRLVQ